jgi:hypothetical protein
MARAKARPKGRPPKNKLTAEFDTVKHFDTLGSPTAIKRGLWAAGWGLILLSLNAVQPTRGTKMLTRIAIVSAPGGDLEKTRAAFRNPMRYTVREFLSMEAVVHGLVTFPMEILVLRVGTFEEKHIEMVLKARRRFHEAAIVTLARDVHPAARVKATTLSRFKLLQEPMEIGDLTAIAEKFRKNDPSAHRLHPRARRDGLVQIIDKRGLVHRGQFLDFAQMGARLLVPSLQRFEARDSVQIVYGSMSEPGKQHRIEAKIVWSAFDGGIVDQFRGVKQQTAGVRFIAAY